MYAKFGWEIRLVVVRCCLTVPNSVHKFAFLTRAVMSMTLTYQVKLFQCHGPMEMGAVRQRVV